VTVAGDRGSESFLVLYRRGDRLIAALGLDQRAQLVRYRLMLSQGTSWSEAMEYARSRTAAPRGPSLPAH
jgi:hypothetical protein